MPHRFVFSLADFDLLRQVEKILVSCVAQYADGFPGEESLPEGEIFEIFKESSHVQKIVHSCYFWLTLHPFC
jgi:hypothetical protein